MESFSKDMLKVLGSSGNKNKYYVYRLIDPRNYLTFYVGKGCGNRVFQHIKDARKLLSQDEDEISLKIAVINEIHAQGKEVLCVIHRWGLTEDTAYEVEAAVIDCYQGLTNIIRGHSSDREVVSVEDFEKIMTAPVYTEPSEDYIIIKTYPNMVSSLGLYEATRQAWRADINKACNYKYVLSVVYGIVKEVYEVSKWYTVKGTNRIAFEGEPTSNKDMVSLKGKMIPDYYRKKGIANPFLYKKK